MRRTRPGSVIRLAGAVSSVPFQELVDGADTGGNRARRPTEFGEVVAAR